MWVLIIYGKRYILKYIKGVDKFWYSNRNSKKILYILDDETIAVKIGLDKEEIKVLRVESC